MTTRERELINDNMQAFIHNFGPVKIEGNYTTGFYVFYPAEADSYIQYCYDISYLDGWLYGVVQGAVRGEFKEYRTGVEHPVMYIEKEGHND